MIPPFLGSPCPDQARLTSQLSEYLDPMLLSHKRSESAFKGRCLDVSVIDIMIVSCLRLVHYKGMVLEAMLIEPGHCGFSQPFRPCGEKADIMSFFKL